MTSEEVRTILDRLGDRYSNYRLAIAIPDGPTDAVIEGEIAALKSAGVHLFLQDGLFGRELIVTDIRSENL